MAEAHEKTELPTTRRREEARRRGEVARSADLASAAVLLAFVALMQSAGPKLLVSFRLMLEGALTRPDVTFTRPELLHFAAMLTRAIFPVLAVVMIVAVIANALQFGLLFRFRLNEEAFDIAKGFERLFSAKSRARMVLDTVKLLAVGSVAYLLVRQQFAAIAGLSRLDVASALGGGMHVVIGVALKIGALLLALGAIDFGYQRWQHERDLRMTRREVKDELRDMEGDPKARQNRSRISKSLASARLARGVASANALITHENQLAVAVRYENALMDAPQIVAKAAGATVARLRESAAAGGIPIIEQEPLARALSKVVSVGGEIPHHLYAAVAQVLAYAGATTRGGQ